MINLTESVAVLSPEAAIKEIPVIASWLLLGAEIHARYNGREGYALELEGEYKRVSQQDLDLAQSVKVAVDQGYCNRMMSGKRLLDFLRNAETFMKGQTNPAKKIAMLKDAGGAGYWRMVLPAKQIEKQLGDSVRIDVTSSEVKFEHLLEYDTIFVQRLMDWDSYRVLEKLRKAGKRIVYDMDDDIFTLSPDNPAFYVIKRDSQQAAIACMRLAHVVTTTTAVLQDRLRQVSDVIPVVVPNALDVNDNWLPVNQVGSPDQWKRIYWQGSSTHEQDWEVCIEAVDGVLQRRKDVRLVLLGYLPKCVVGRLGSPWWQGRVEHVGFNNPETYFQMIHHVRAEVAIAPLYPQTFNEAKSAIKWLEATMIGIPVVASNMEPYSSVVENGVDGYLVEPTVEAWSGALDRCLDMDKGKRERVVRKAREKASERYDIESVVESWKKVLLP